LPLKVAKKMQQKKKLSWPIFYKKDLMIISKKERQNNKMKIPKF